MRSVCLIIMAAFCLSMSVPSANAQKLAKALSIEPHKLEITNAKTTSIIFPYAIVSVDRGSKDVLAQKANGVQNILQVKAAKDTIAETNLTVVTSDGKISSFIITYAKEPAVLNLSLVGNDLQSPKIVMSSEKINEAEVKARAESFIRVEKRIRGLEENNYDTYFSLNGLFVIDDVFYFRIVVKNNSNISYDIDQLRFFIRDLKKPRRTSSQEIEAIPIYSYLEPEKVLAHSVNTFIVALPKFTIPDKKYLAIQLMEKNGGRHMKLSIKNKHIMKSTPYR